MRLVRKASVYSSGVAVKEEICYAMDVADRLHRQETGRDAEFTSIVDGQHSKTSLHYAGLACDLRTWFLDNHVSFRNMLAEALGPDYDVILEPTHIHVEFQPKR